jgi:MFS family permease
VTVLRLRDVRLIVGAVGLSAVGDTVLWVLLALHVGATGGSALAVSAMFVCLWGPVVALGGVAGRIVDRHENRRLLIGVSLAQAAVVAGMAFGSGSLPVLLALCVLLGAGVAVSSPAEFALVPAAAGEERVHEANGHVEAARYLGMTAGPVLGGALAAAGLTRLGLLLDAASFLAVAAAGVALHARRDPRRAAAPHATGREHGGVRICFADRTLAIALAASIASLLFFTISVAAEVFFVADVLHAGPAAYGVLMSAWMLGMVAGAVGLARRVPRGWLAGGALAGIALQGAGLLGAAIGATVATALVAFLVGGVAHGAKNVLLRTLIHERVPEARRGRAFATYNALRNGAELGALGAGGVLVGLAGAQVALAVSGAIPLLIGIAACALLASGYARTHDRAPAADGRVASMAP